MAHYQKSLAAAVVLNTAISAVEALTGFESGSLSLMMDAGHNLSDVLGLVLAWVAAVLTRKRPEGRYTYGRPLQISVQQG